MVGADAVSRLSPLRLPCCLPLASAKAGKSSLGDATNQKSPPFGGLGLVEFGDELAADVQAARRRVSVIVRR
jgi:hypothetical protein